MVDVQVLARARQRAILPTSDDSAEAEQHDDAASAEQQQRLALVRRCAPDSRTVPADVVITEAVSVDRGPEDAAHELELRKLVWEAAAGLPRQDQVMLELHVYQGLRGGELDGGRTWE